MLAATFLSSKEAYWIRLPADVPHDNLYLLFKSEKVDGDVIMKKNIFARLETAYKYKKTDIIINLDDANDLLVEGYDVLSDCYINKWWLIPEDERIETPWGIYKGTLNIWGDEVINKPFDEYGQ